MPASSADSLTRLLGLARKGDEAAASEVFARVNAELRDRAKRLFGGEKGGHTLQPTAVVNEVWFKLRGREGQLDVPDLENRGLFFAIAARSMREVLVDYARRRKRAKRGRGYARITLDERDHAVDPPATDVLDLHEALSKLHTRKPRAAQVVELKHFGGCTNDEAALALGISTESVKGDWRFARAWLKRELAHDQR